MEKHTKGEWEVVGNKIMAKDHCICQIYSGTDSYTPSKLEAKANAALITAAPKMLEALKECRKELMRLRTEMLKPANERDSFWIAAFLQAPMCGQDLITLSDKLIQEVTK